jgi:hypothetical protein
VARATIPQRAHRRGRAQADEQPMTRVNRAGASKQLAGLASYGAAAIRVGTIAPETAEHARAEIG